MCSLQTTDGRSGKERRGEETGDASVGGKVLRHFKTREEEEEEEETVRGYVHTNAFQNKTNHSVVD